MARIHHRPRPLSLQKQQRRKVKVEVEHAGEAPEAEAAGLDSGGMDFDADGEGDGDGQHKGQHRIHLYKQGRKGGVAGVKEVADSDAEAESGATTAQGISRKGMGGGLGDDGFDQGQKSREAYESYLKGNVEQDAARFESLRQGGASDSFDPALKPKAVEALGKMQAATHLVRLYDHWMLDGQDRTSCIKTAATWLSEFQNVGTVKKVLTEMESKPIRDVYPVEVVLKILDDSPASLPSVKRGSLFANTEIGQGTKPVFAGHAVMLPVPKNTRIKGFALLGGARPGYEFFPSPKKSDHYELLVDTPGKWTFALTAVPVTELGGGKIKKEGTKTLVETLTIDVQRMGRKDGTPSLADASEEVAAKENGPFTLDSIQKTDGVGLRAGQKKVNVGLPASIAKNISGNRSAVEGGVVVSSLSNQMRDSFDEIIRDRVQPGEVQTYSLEASFTAPGSYGSALDASEITSVSIENASPFDGRWKDALEHLGHALKEWEPDAKPPVDSDLKRAFRRAKLAKE
ncbi:MAG: hypothetical protein GY822_15800 [Deltaproteobacteria bacterium]|nr:hypothetical protein [Deltaproteobacteria bacterium]